MLNKVLAVDFDGTLCKEAYPNIGAPIPEVINAVKQRQAEGWDVILWTIREGDRLKEAVDWCNKHGLYFTSVNESTPQWKAYYGNNPRKVGATEYWDDRAVNPLIV